MSDTSALDETLKNNVASKLRERGFALERDRALGGLRADFVIRLLNGEVVVVEVKPWQPTHSNLQRAEQQVERYQRATGADRVFLVLQELAKQPLDSKGVVTLDGLLLILSVLNQAARHPRSKAKGRKPGLMTVKKKRRHQRPMVKIFAAMPFESGYDDVYFVAMVGAAKRLKGLCDRTDHSEFVGDIPAVIRQRIRTSDVVICDLSEAKPNVLYETGFAHALEKKAVHICSTPLNKLPFDVSHFNTIEYHRGSTHKLIEPLVQRLRAILKS
jgi:hypothetical protein